MHRRENPLCDLEDRARTLQGFGIVQAEREKKPGRARPFFPSGLPHSAAPRGACGSQQCVTGGDVQAIERESPSAQKDLRNKRWLQLDVEQPDR